MMEAGVAIDADGDPLYWHAPPDRSVGSLPDSRNLWDVFWNNRAELSGFAHSHPGGGIPGPSWTDITTFAGVESGLGRRLKWWITSSESVVVCTWQGPGKYDYKVDVIEEPSWVSGLRQLSNYR